MSILRVKNWTRYQHYKDRCPPWIKLATDTFQNYEFSRLQDASKLLAICIWTLASRSKDGSVPNDFEYLKGLGRLGAFIKLEHLKELINQGFVEVCSEVLADCKQTACSETEGETETEGEKSSSAVPSEPAKPPVLVFPCNGSVKTWDLTAEQVAAWVPLYPGVPVELECRKSLAWVLANGKKTAAGMEKFLVRWLNKQNDTPARKGNGYQQSAPRPTRPPGPPVAIAELAGERARQLAERAQAANQEAAERFKQQRESDHGGAG